jgi:hypothetical protein
MTVLHELPGHDLFSAGVADLQAGRRSEAGLLVSLARTRLIQAGLDVPRAATDRPSHELYDLILEQSPTNAHGRYNALLRRIVSFARAAEHEASR